jgi:Ca2+-binding EF-hand superfamily protein
MQAEIEATADKLCDFDKFVQYASSQWIPRAEFESKANASILAFDMNKKGSMSVSEFKKTFTKFGEKWPEEEVSQKRT